MHSTKRVYRLWICDDWVPHEGQADVEEVVRRVRMISSDTSTSSTSISGKSAMIIIGCVLVPRKTNENENLFNPLLYHNWHQQSCVRTDLQFNQHTIPWRVILIPLCPS